MLKFCFIMCRYQGHISAALVLGGVDSTGPHLYSVYPHGSTDKLPYVTMGMFISQHSLHVNKHTGTRILVLSKTFVSF